MGFLDKLLSGLGGAAVGFATGGPAGAIAGGIGGLLAEDEDPSTAVATMKPSNTSITRATTAPDTRLTTPSTASKLLSGLVLGPLPLGALALSERAEAAAGLAAIPGGGKNRVITTVSTINPAGQIIKQKQLAGRPFLMNKDIVTAKRVFRTIQKASGRLPRRTVKEGKTKQLTDAVMDKALSNVITDGGKC